MRPESRCIFSQNVWHSGLLCSLLLGLQVCYAEPMIDEDLLQNFRDMTVAGYNYRQSKGFHYYFSPDGALLSQHTKLKPKKTVVKVQRGLWRVNAGKLCVQWENKQEQCHKLVREGAILYRYDKQGEKLLSFHTFSRGNTLYEDR